MSVKRYTIEQAMRLEENPNYIIDGWVLAGDYASLLERCEDVSESLRLESEKSSRLVCEKAELLERCEKMEKFIGNITDALGPYPELNGTQVVFDAYKALAAKEAGHAD